MVNSSWSKIICMSDTYVLAAASVRQFQKVKLELNIVDGLAHAALQSRNPSPARMPPPSAAASLVELR